jgi:Ca2+-binding EF-hand superfamily protein
MNMTAIAASTSGSSQYLSMQSKLYNKLDSDGDGSLTKDEFVAGRPKDVTAEMAASLYGKINESGSGALSKADFENAFSSENSVSGVTAQMTSGIVSMLMDRQGSLPKPGGGGAGEPSASDMFSSLDADGDGKVTEEEFLAAKPDDVSADQVAALFKTIDTEGSGSITENQFASFLQSRSPQPAGQMQPPPSGGGSSSAGSSSQEVFDPLDTNKDGVVSAAELLAGGVSVEATQAASETGTTAASDDSSSTDNASQIAQDLLKQLMGLIQNFNGNYVDSNAYMDSLTNTVG